MAACRMRSSPRPTSPPRASVVRDTASLVTAIKQVDLLKAELDRTQATLAHDEAVQRQAELNL